MQPQYSIYLIGPLGLVLVHAPYPATAMSNALRLAKPHFAFGQRLLGYSLLRSLPQQTDDEHRLCKEKNYTDGDVVLIGFPKTWLAIEHDTVGREVLFIESPASQSAPVKHVGVGAFDDWDVLGLLPVENPHSHIAGNEPLLGIVGYKTSYGSVTNQRVCQSKDRGIGRTYNQRK